MLTTRRKGAAAKGAPHFRDRNGEKHAFPDRASELVARAYGYGAINMKAKQPDDMMPLNQIKAADVPFDVLRTRVPEMVDRWRDAFGG